MKTDFRISIDVNLGVSPELVQLIGRIMQPMAEPAGVKVQPEPEPEPKEKPETASEEPRPETEQQPEPEPEPEPQPEPEPEPKEKQYTEADIREVMHKVRQRIEGEDYKENAKSEAYVKYHKALTRQFIGIAEFLGYEKPSVLPPDKRADFARECELLQVLEDGTIGKPLTF